MSQEVHDEVLEVLAAWQTPAPDDTALLRPKQFQLVRLHSGRLAVCKTDSSPEYIAHESDVLEVLRGVKRVPSLLRTTSTSIYTSYVEGKPLSDAVRSLRTRACVAVGWQILSAVASIHRRGVVHGDIKPWNFIYTGNGQLYLIDFEYAYCHCRSYAAGLLEVHHGSVLKTACSDWIDAWWSVADIWRNSSSPVCRFIARPAAVGLSWLSRLERGLTRRFLKNWTNAPLDGASPHR